MNTSPRPSAIGISQPMLHSFSCEVSRAHAAFECYGPRMLVRDLGSRNGTFVREQKVETAPLEDHSEFRVGGTLLMVVVTETD